MRSSAAVKSTTENPEMADRFNRILGETVEVLEESGLRYLFIGGIASGGLGRPRSTHDIDVFVTPEDAERVLRALSKKGFRVERTDPSWLYKAFKESVLVDVIFKSKGEIYLDQEMYQRSTTAEFHGKRLRLVAPEDLTIIKALAHGELTPGHWHDALALVSHASMDWDYLVRRARKAPRRVLSLLLYAQSNDIYVPKPVIDRLYQSIFGDMGGDMGGGRGDMPSASQGAASSQKTPASASGRASETVRRLPLHVVPGASRVSEYAVGDLRTRIAEDSRTNELDVQVELVQGKIVLRGEVLSMERRNAVLQIAHEMFDRSLIEDQIRVSEYPEPSEAETLK